MGNNIVLSHKDYYVSYNPDTGAEPAALGLTLIANILTTGRSFEDGEETALKDKKTGEWYILKGDFRKEFEAAFPKGIDALIAVYEKNKDKRSEWSTV